MDFRDRAATFLSAKSLDEARDELQDKTCGQIEFETAVKWAARAVAAMELYRATGHERWLMLCAEYGSEAIEHAGAAGDGYADAMRSELHAAGARP
jgi:hypothetical protein